MELCLLDMLSVTYFAVVDPTVFQVFESSTELDVYNRQLLRHYLLTFYQNNSTELINGRA